MEKEEMTAKPLTKEEIKEMREEITKCSSVQQSKPADTSKEETLSEKRKELFEIILKERPTTGRIFRIIKKQDKEFLKKLKEEIEAEIKIAEKKSVIVAHILKVVILRIDQLAGEKLM